MNTYSVNFGLLSLRHDSHTGEMDVIDADSPAHVRQILEAKYGWSEIIWCNATPMDQAMAEHAARLEQRRAIEAIEAAALEAIQPAFRAEVDANGLIGKSKIGSRRALRARLLKEHAAAQSHQA